MADSPVLRQGDLRPAVLRSMKSQGIDAELTLDILNAWNGGRYRSARREGIADFPVPDKETVLDMTRFDGYTVPEKDAAERLSPLVPGIRPRDFARSAGGGNLHFPARSLQTIGRLLFPYVSFGILNGGSATSYCDTKKNAALNGELFELLKDTFMAAAAFARGKPKGISPAYANPDGSPGYSFLELKLRRLLLEARLWRTAADRRPEACSGAGAGTIAGSGAAFGAGSGPRDFRGTGLYPLAPVFQMTSVFTSRQTGEALDSYQKSPLLENLIAETGIDITRVRTGVQPLIAAFTHSQEGERRGIFTRAWGKEDSVLGLPGGHGQNFFVLRDVYRGLLGDGKRFVYLGNADNLGFVPDPVSLAVLALSGKPAGFEFAFKTAVDTKGGVLVRDSGGRLTCADIGAALSAGDIEAAEKAGKPILFNAATGLFDLEYLVTHLEEIREGIPLRWSDQDKDAGRYSQAEQVTWEIMGLLPDPLIFGVNKFRRFLAAKLLLESLITSGLGLESRDFPLELQELARSLHGGFVWNMEHVFGMKRSGGGWAASEESGGSGDDDDDDTG
ncbi:MAG: UTP--glucose-1-phosphate uridylyltransferase [Spirochaetales bacterium]|jgi:UDP-N-acetylglucosamine pyrophosphorylase|nr:UTP--glucose-1-phosphate uridylyltransferase [Spirochaetales bacterium]